MKVHSVPKKAIEKRPKVEIKEKAGDAKDEKPQEKPVEIERASGLIPVLVKEK